MKNVLTAIALMGILTASASVSANVMLSNEKAQTAAYYLGAPCAAVEAPCAVAAAPCAIEAPCAAPCADPCPCVMDPWPTETVCMTDPCNPCAVQQGCCPKVLGFMQRNNNRGL